MKRDLSLYGNTYVVEAFNNESPDIILVEGQGAVSHPAFMSSLKKQFVGCSDDRSHKHHEITIKSAEDLSVLTVS